MSPRPLKQRIRTVLRQWGLRLYFYMNAPVPGDNEESLIVAKPGYYGKLIDHNLFLANLTGLPAFRYNQRYSTLYPQHGAFLIRRIQSALFQIETSITFHPNGMATIFHTELYRHQVVKNKKHSFTDWYGDCQQYTDCFPYDSPTLWRLSLTVYRAGKPRLTHRHFQSN